MPKPILDPDVNRITLEGAKQYPNCLGFAVKRNVKGVGNRFVDACSSGMNQLDGLTDFQEILRKVKDKINPVCKRHWIIAGTSERIPTTHAPDISKRRLIGVGQDSDGDLHFYVVTSTNGDGQGICGTLDAQTNKVLPCKLRNGSLLQFQGHTSDPQKYRLLGFFTTTLAEQENPVNGLQ